MLADVRLRVGLAFGLSLMIAMAQSLERLAVVSIGALGVALWCYRGQWLRLGKRLLPANMLLLMMVVLLGIKWGSWQWQPDGLLVAGRAIVRANAAMLCCASLCYGLTSWQLAYAIQALSRSSKLALLGFLMVRYIADLQQHKQRLERAMLARGFVAQPFIRRCQATALLIAQVFLVGLDKSERLRQALLVRGYQGVFVVTDEAKMRASSCVAAGACLLLVAGILWVPIL